MGKHNCRVCGCELILGENWAPSDQKGHNCICKSCKSQYDKQYYKEHKEEKSQYHKQYRKEHKEERRQYNKQYCKEHKEEIRQQSKQYYAEHKEEIGQHQIKYKYGLSLGKYKAMLKAQDNKCAICRKTFVDARHTFVDHDHNTGEVRGILCNNCNTVLGHSHDDPEVLLRAAVYLKNANKGVK